jgi:hypothetical protein
MADREMIAATLAAGILSAADCGPDPDTDPAEYAVTLYQHVLAALAKAAETPPVLISPELLARARQPRRRT